MTQTIRGNYYYLSSPVGMMSLYLISYAGVDVESQEAYELASQGLIRPQEKSPPLIYSIKCVAFDPPNFTLGEREFFLF